jgi:hypothetical protein
LIHFFGEILKIVKFNCELALRQVIGIVQTIFKHRRFLLDSPEECASFVGEAIADYDRAARPARAAAISVYLFNSDEFNPSELL